MGSAVPALWFLPHLGLLRQEVFEHVSGHHRGSVEIWQVGHSEDETTEVVETPLSSICYNKRCNVEYYGRAVDLLAPRDNAMLG